MRKRFGRPNIPLLVISMLLSLTLWIIVEAQSMQIKSNTISVPLRWDNLDPNYVVTNIATSIPVTIEGPGDKLSDPGLRSAEAVVDLRHSTPGRATYSAKIEAPDPDVQRLLPTEFSKVLITIEPKSWKPVNVVVQPKGRISDRNLRYDASTTEPSVVRFTGSQSQISRIATARVILDLGDVDPNDSERVFSLPVEALDSQGRDVPGVVPSDSLIKVRPTVEPASVDKELFIIPNVTGRPPAGYEVTEYRAIPEKVSVTGASMLLAQTSTIHTDPINVTGLTRTVTLRAKLLLPAELQLLDPRPVTVRVTIQRQAILKAPPAAPPPAHTEPPFPDHVPPLTPAKGGSH